MLILLFRDPHPPPTPPFPAHTPSIFVLFGFPPWTTLQMPCVCLFLNTAEASTLPAKQMEKKRLYLSPGRKNKDRKIGTRNLFFLFYFCLFFFFNLQTTLRFLTLADFKRLQMSLCSKQTESHPRAFAFSFSLLIPRECKYNVQQRHGTKRWRAAEQERWK